MSTAAPECRWNPTAQRRAAHGVSARWTTLQNRASAYTLGSTTFAHARRVRVDGSWNLYVEGWEWKISPDMLPARLPLGRDTTHWSVKNFPTLRAAQREAEAIIAAAGTGG